MDYKVLYRKYRPDDFDNIVGQNYTISILKNSIKNDKISHAYIFSGPRGTGKTSTAKVFAKAINCEHPSESGPCNKCQACLNFKENADIIEIDAASNNGVDEIRELINNIKLAPSYSKYKVYIIDEVHMLSTSAFNALLLTLEEPPKHIVFILATTNIEAVPITILSRCQRFDFRKISINDIMNRLKYIIHEEKIDIDDLALEEIAYISEGGMRDALSILDQLASNNSKITLNDVIEHFGSVSKKQINDLFENILNNNVNNFIKMMKNFKDLAIDYKLLIKKILEKIEEESINSKKDCNYSGLPYDTLKDMAFALASISNYININIDPYLLIEITLLKYFHKGNEQVHTLQEDTEHSPLMNENKDDFQSESMKENDTSELKEISNDLISIRINNCFVNAKKEYLQAIKQEWAAFLDNISDDKILLNLLADANIVAASDQVAILSNGVEGTVNLINSKLEEIANLFKKYEKKDYKFIALSEETWNKEKKKYINNLKNKYVYEYITEASPSIDEEIIDKMEATAYDIFDKEKIEIE